MSLSDRERAEGFLAVHGSRSFSCERAEGVLDRFAFGDGPPAERLVFPRLIESESGIDEVILRPVTE